MNGKERTVNTFLGHGPSSWEMPGGLAPCSLRFFFWNENQMRLLPGARKNSTWKSKQHLSRDSRELGSGVRAPPFKREVSTTWSQSRCGLQPPSALKVPPPRWSTQWCRCHRSGTQTGSRWSGWSLPRPQTPCFCWASSHCGRNGNPMSWEGGDGPLALHLHPVPSSKAVGSPVEAPAPVSPCPNQTIRLTQTRSTLRY